MCHPRRHHSHRMHLEGCSLELGHPLVQPRSPPAVKRPLSASPVFAGMLPSCGHIGNYRSSAGLYLFCYFLTHPPGLASGGAGKTYPALESLRLPHSQYIHLQEYRYVHPKLPTLTPKGCPIGPSSHVSHLQPSHQNFSPGQPRLPPCFLWRTFQSIFSQHLEPSVEEDPILL